MNVVAFLGPSRPTSFSTDGLTIRPPAAAGDLLSLLRGTIPDAVLLIDGYFDARPSPWHKEILMLLEVGVSVVGGASMGALRAAELETFGMLGVGRVFEAFRSGLLTADDEVAVLHGPSEWNFRPITVALVNIRYTMLRAVRQRVLLSSHARLLLGCAKRLHFHDRTWDQVMREGRACGLPEESSSRFSVWLLGNFVDLKAQDAALVLASTLSVRTKRRIGISTPRTVHLLRLAEATKTVLPEKSVHPS